MSEKEKRGDPKITEIVREYISLTNNCIVPQFFIFFLQFWCNKKKKLFKQTNVSPKKPEIFGRKGATD